MWGKYNERIGNFSSERRKYKITRYEENTTKEQEKFHQFTSLYAFAIASSWPYVVLPNDGAAAEDSKLSLDSATPPWISSQSLSCHNS
jgi:hypothetical protein